MTNIAKLLLFMAIATVTMTAQGHGDNPLLQKWNTPYQTPPFSKIAVEHYDPAVRTGIKEAEANIRRITNNPEAATFENTIVAMQTASETLDRVCAIMYNLNECHTSPELQKVVEKLTPLITRYENSVSMNKKLFERVKAVYDNRDNLQLTAEQLTLLENTYKGFVRHGVALKGNARKEYARNSERLAALSQKMNKNVLADGNEYTLHITREEDLSGLPANVVAAARQEAQERKLEGWVFTLAYPSYGPFITYADNRSLREQMWRAYNSRGNRGNRNDNNDIIREITALRLRQAQLLGYHTYCEYVLSDRMCQTPGELMAFYKQLINASMPAAQQDLIAVSQYAEAHGGELPLQRWDFSYYSEKLKQQKYTFNTEELRPYFSLERVRQGIFDLYGRLYGLTFNETKGVEVYHPDVKVYEVRDGSRLMGLLYLDMHPRPSKRSGAWMTEFRDQSNINGHEVRPLIQVVCNFSKPVGDKPALLSFDEVETFMHEFGHAMHGMLSDCTYPSLSGTSVKRDFVEMPSQVMENWCYEPQFLNTFAKHYITGDTIPAEYIQKIKDAERYMAGWLCLRQICLGLADMAYHSIVEPFDVKVEEFERNHMIELLPPVEGCNTSTAFTHIFAGGYASGYYGYKWAEVLDADVFSVFKEKGIFDKETANTFRREVISRGGSEHPSVLLRRFMGRETSINAFMIRSGFVEEIKTMLDE